MTELKELNAIEKLEAVKACMEAFGYSFENVTIAEAFSMYRNIKTVIEPALDKPEL